MKYTVIPISYHHIYLSKLKLYAITPVNHLSTIFRQVTGGAYRKSQNILKISGRKYIIRKINNDL